MSKEIHMNPMDGLNSLNAETADALVAEMVEHMGPDVDDELVRVNASILAALAERTAQEGGFSHDTMAMTLMRMLRVGEVEWEQHEDGGIGLRYVSPASELRLVKKE